METYDIPLIVLAVLVVIANSTVCILVYCTHSLRTYTNGFVVSLAVSDILTGGVFFPCYFARASFKGYVVAIALLSGIISVCLVTFDRYIAVLHPLRYANIVNRKLFIKLLTGGWVLAISYSMVPLIWRTEVKNVAHKVYMLFLQLAVWIPHLLIFVIYYRIYLQVKKCIRREKNCLPLKENRKRLRWFSREAKYIQIFIIVAMMFLLSWLPILYMTAVAWFERMDLIPRALPIISHYTMAFGSLVNPFIYSFKKPDFRTALRRLFTKKGQIISASGGRVEWLNLRPFQNSSTRSKGSVRETNV